MPKDSHVFLGWKNPTGDFRLPELGEQEQVSLFFGGEQSSQRMNQNEAQIGNLPIWFTTGFNSSGSLFI